MKVIGIVFAILILLAFLSGCIVQPPPVVYQTPPQPSPQPSSPPPNHPPVVSVGPAQECWTGGQVVLQATASDPDGDQLYYSWTCNGGALSNYSILWPTFYAPNIPGEYICTLTVGDGRGGIAQASTTVRVVRRCQECYPVVTVQVNPKYVCIGSPINIFGRVSFSYDCDDCTGYKDPLVQIYLDGLYIGETYTDSSGYFSFTYYYTNSLWPRTHTVRVVSKIDCSRQDERTDYFEAATCKPCGCAVCPCPQPCPCPVCPCPPGRQPPPPPQDDCPTCRGRQPPPPPDSSPSNPGGGGPSPRPN